MKLRIQGNSLRIRIGRSEFERLLSQGRIEDSIQIPPASDASFTYALEVSDSGDPLTQVRYSPCQVAVTLTRKQVELWSQEGEVGIRAQIPIGNGNSLEVLVEKDFACLDRGEEGNEDTFANPRAGKSCQVA